MDDIVLWQKLQRSGYIKDKFSQFILIIFKATVKLFVMNSIHFFIIVLLTF